MGRLEPKILSVFALALALVLDNGSHKTQKKFGVFCKQRSMIQSAQRTDYAAFLRSVMWAIVRLNFLS